MTEKLIPIPEGEYIELPAGATLHRPIEETGAAVEIEGTSSMTKPTKNIGVNAKFWELDTGDFYYFTGSAWAKIGG